MANKQTSIFVLLLRRANAETRHVGCCCAVYSVKRSSASIFCRRRHQWSCRRRALWAIPWGSLQQSEP